MTLAPIALFVYNRPEHTKKTIQALQKNFLAEQSELWVFSDAAKTPKDERLVEQVRELLNPEGFNKVKVVERASNMGLADSIITGISEILKDNEKVITLEDDLITSPYFLEYMNQALDFYQGDDKVCSITGFSFASEFMKFPKDFLADIYLNIRPMSWSWATWKSEWDGIDWEVQDFNDFISSKDKIREFNKGGTDLTSMLQAQMSGSLDSWYIRWCYNSFLKGKYTIYPKISFVNNIGHDNTGVHCGEDSKNIYSHNELNLNNNLKFEKNITLNKLIVSKFNKAFNPPLTSKIKRQIKNILKYAKVS